MAGKVAKHLALTGALMAALSGCGQLPTSQTYLSEPTYGVYLAFPADWSVLEADKVEGGNYSQTFGRGVSQPEQVLAGAQPSGFVAVSIVDGTLEEVLNQAAGAVVTNLEDAINQKRARILEGPTEEEDQSSVSREWVVTVELDNSTEALTYRHKVIVGKSPVGASPEGEKQLLKTLAIGCTGSCYADNEAIIGTVFSSWKVT